MQRRDPVSGNPIPPGGTAEGVRDDKMARVSGGEYIFPADVVSFLGVDKLAQMHRKAKEQMAALMSMNSEPDPKPAGFADGGYVDPQKGFDPMAWMYPGFSYINQLNPVTDPNKPKTNTNNPNRVQQYKIFVNDKGEQISILFIDGVAQEEIPEGYTELSDPYANIKRETSKVFRDDDNERQRDNYFNMTAEDALGKIENMGAGQALFDFLPGLAGGVLGGLMKNGVRSELLAMAAVYAERGMPEVVNAANAKLEELGLTNDGPKMGGILGNIFNSEFDPQRIVEQQKKDYYELPDEQKIDPTYQPYRTTDTPRGATRTGQAVRTNAQGIPETIRDTPFDYTPQAKKTFDDGRSGVERGDSSVGSTSTGATDRGSREVAKDSSFRDTGTTNTNTGRDSRSGQSTGADSRSGQTTGGAPYDDYDTVGPFYKGGLVKKPKRR